ncbi:bifunctional adenosylcobinamide kinase/adenosylcobinamide-phosphate guanylyltransferase [Pseudalkalibacillus berkeleyi]|uniref:Adenosylcobinamide kinase n=1 Tax=Pseudalkalibacillus berkeleyi TaxID=1069813 RepID=A0ABS9H0C6_9BACL|nr:bifunctional adenosylcobinamide kinase/adenosylcobinamide-phosphate guanylyltransferase [Pseudalkalibacillus berkeleyi]MCF6137471.1 bifunctional adenosylcobinamide kinase/adenosylcobinamide-phosphate guanylyltransferase [Pseudalkalibacillus berkeleyi]
MTTPTLVFISGGVRSGKSSYAENLSIQIADETNSHLHYIATGVPSDQEMEERIKMHKDQRLTQNKKWITWEKADGIGELAPHFNHRDVLLLDCLTTLVNNEFFLNTGETVDCIENRIFTSIERLQHKCHTLIVVSNEVFFDTTYDTKLVLPYKKLLGRLHQRIVKQASYAFRVEFGTPIKMKGDSL